MPNLLIVFIISELKFSLIYGINSNLTLFLEYIFSKLVLSILGFKFFSKQYFSISFLSIHNIGLM
ncbi:hypothetical protein D3C81_456920 [compost metagenome]